ncbi:LysR family transcriptional regulator [Paraburkholderia sp. EG285A]|uniref:LysR family transcriptional regulator n=1 Tax=Paraburkholderia sp. EG285A TaxID=3237009 RepID=UPI0034D252D5
MNYYAAVRAFLVTSELGSFSIAAKTLSVNASTVSHYVSGLEAELGVELFSRSTRGVILTEWGLTFRERVRGAVDALNEARAATLVFRDADAEMMASVRRRQKGRPH